MRANSLPAEASPVPLDLASIRAWLTTKNPDEIVGLCRHFLECPLHLYISERLNFRSMVAVYGKYVVIGTDRYELPPETVRLINLIDLSVEMTGDFAITAGEVLSYLALMAPPEAALAAV